MTAIQNKTSVLRTWRTCSRERYCPMSTSRLRLSAPMARETTARTPCLAQESRWSSLRDAVVDKRTAVIAYPCSKLLPDRALSRKKTAQRQSRIELHGPAVRCSLILHLAFRTVQHVSRSLNPCLPSGSGECGPDAETSKPNQTHGPQTEDGKCTRRN